MLDDFRSNNQPHKRRSIRNLKKPELDLSDGHPDDTVRHVEVYDMHDGPADSQLAKSEDRSMYREQSSLSREVAQRAEHGHAPHEDIFTPETHSQRVEETHQLYDELPHEFQGHVNGDYRRDVPLSSGVAPVESDRVVPRHHYHSDPEMFEESSGPRWGLWLLAAPLLLVLGIFSAMTFSSAIVEVEQKTASALVDIEDADVDVKTVVSDVVTVTKDLGVLEVDETKPQSSGEPASGTITVMNDFSSVPRKLVRRTRFESSDGKIYRILEEVSVPGFTDAGPGSIEVRVVADDAGAEANIEAGKLTIPGFTGMDEFKGIWGEVETPVVAVSGVSLDDEERVKVESEMRSKLESQASKIIEDLLPEGYVALVDSVKKDIEFQDIEVDEDNSGSLVASMEITLNAVHKENLKAALFEAVEEVPEGDTSVRVHNITDLVLELDDDAVNITGQPIFIWQYDREKLTDALAGKSLRDTNEILTDFSSINTVSATIKPLTFLQRRYPKNEKRIELKDLALE